MHFSLIWYFYTRGKIGKKESHKRLLWALQPLSSSWWGRWSMETIGLLPYLLQLADHGPASKQFKHSHLNGLHTILLLSLICLHKRSQVDFFKTLTGRIFSDFSFLNWYLTLKYFPRLNSWINLIKQAKDYSRGYIITKNKNIFFIWGLHIEYTEIQYCLIKSLV